MAKKKPSFSLLDTFAQCERKVYFNAMFGEGPESGPIVQGSQIHLFLERVGKLAKAGAPWDEAVGLAAVPEGPLATKGLRSYGDRVASLLRDHKPQDVELWFSQISHPFSLTPLPCRGKIDLLTDREIIDYKTIGGAHRIKAGSEAKRSLQLRIYCMATGRRSASFLWLPPTGDAVLQSVTFTDEELWPTWLWIDQTIKVMDARWTAGESEAAWALAHPDNFLCQERFCAHWARCIGKKPQTPTKES